MSRVSAVIRKNNEQEIPFFFDNEKVLAPDHISVAFATHGMWLAAESYRRESMSILDLGSGSGIQAVSAMLAASGDALYQITSVDNDEDAVATTATNLMIADRYTGENVQYRAFSSDWFSKIRREKFDLILCNPPYLEENALISHIHAQKAPPTSLFETHPLAAYTLIISQLQNHLNEDGIAIFRTQLTGDQRSSVESVAANHGLMTSRVGTHDGNREGSGTVMYARQSMPPGLNLPVAKGVHLELVYPGMNDGGTKKPLTEEGKYWCAVLGFKLPDASK
jgi:methylase of polypeptide subunit release factors